MNQPAQSTARLITGRPGAVLMKMAASVMIGFAAGAAFNITDTYFVSRLGTVPLAAMGFTLPVTMVVFGLSLGVSVGTSSVLARAIGRGQHDQVRHVVGHALLLGVVLVAILVVVGLLTMRPLFTAMGADEKTLPLVIDYMGIWYTGIIFLVIPIVGNGAIRATGDTFSPAMIMLVDLGLNIVLDPFLIFGIGPFPAMGIRGAALATVFCRALALAASLYVLIRRKGLLTWRWDGAAMLWDSWRKILYVGMPVAYVHILLPVVMGILVHMVSTLGTGAVAAFGAGLRISHCAMIPIFAVGASLVPFVGQNWGAGLFERVRKGHGRPIGL